jgi:hypothetical protein
MPATYEVRVFHGASPGTDSLWPAGGIYHQADSTPSVVDNNTAIPIPTSGTNYSRRKYVKLKTTAAPTGTESNLRWSTDGQAWGTGVGFHVTTVSAYAQSTSADHSALGAGMVDATQYTDASPLVVNAGTVLTATTGFGTQDFVVTQVSVGASASPGATAARALKYRVDET